MKVYLLGVNVVIIQGAETYFVPASRTVFSREGDEYTIHDLVRNEKFYCSRADLIDKDDNTFANNDLADEYLAGFVGGFKSASGGSGARNIIVETDNVVRTFTGTEAVGKVWSEQSFKANSKLMLTLYVPCYNNNNSIGNVRTKVEYSINGADWTFLGRSGDYVCGNHSGAHDEIYFNQFLFDPGQVSDFNIQFRFLHQAGNGGVAEVNNYKWQSGDGFITHFTIEEILN